MLGAKLRQDWHFRDDFPSQSLDLCQTPSSLLNQSLDWYWQNWTELHPKWRQRP